MSTFYLIRHALHSLVDRVLCGRMVDASLSPQGHEQARGLSLQFAGKPIDFVRSSPRRRARETAEPIALRLGLEVECAGAIDEHDAGDWAGLSFQDLNEDPAWRAWNAHRNTARPPRGETMGELQSRVIGYVEELRAHDDAVGILVTHAEPIRAALLHYREMPFDRFGEMDIAPGSVSVLRAHDGLVDAREINLPGPPP